MMVASMGDNGGALNNGVTMANVRLYRFFNSSAFLSASACSSSYRHQMSTSSQIQAKDGLFHQVSERDLDEEVAIAFCGGRDWHRGGVVAAVGGVVVLVSWQRR
ncbi:uncharacterized protein HKW66_Vig0007280 [Vigna angularis]|uniref:Uncharacterized protein n=2 Tax=Phaseolus angularis TaxID=3914 RepID=A0A8T0LHW1_PHAAN|nr:uncharacterized protein HKW66_Vig0007280 [Vigna angularis]